MKLKFKLNFNKVEEKKGLTFDEEKHEYKQDGKVVRSVTQILQDTGISPDLSKIDPGYLKYCADRGTAAHKAVELFLNGKLNEDSLHGDIVNYFQSFKKWWAIVKEDGFNLVSTEKKNVGDFKKKIPGREHLTLK